MAQLEKLSPKKVETAKSTGKEVWLSDGGNLYLRVRPTGKAWFFWYTSPIPGADPDRPKLSLGPYPDISLAQARERARVARAIVAQGRCPKEEAEHAAVEAKIEATPRTVADLLQQWRTGYLVNHHTDQGKYAHGMLLRHAMPTIGGLQLARLRAQHISAMLTEVASTGKKRTTAVVFSNLRQMLVYAVERGWLPGDPMAAMRKTTFAGPKTRRQRALSTSEIAELAQKLPTSGLPERMQCAVWIILSCLTRVDETGLARLRNIDFEQGVWRIPAEDQKKVRGRERVDHYVNISPFAIHWFRRLIALQQEAAVRAWERLPHASRPPVPVFEIDYLFKATGRGGAINEKTVSHALKDRQMLPGDTPRAGRTKASNTLILWRGTFTPHDLRRTGSTLMRELRVRPDVVDRCQNHVEANEIVATYQVGELREEMREAWCTLGAKLEEIYDTAMAAAAAEKDI